jgi:hypothetical protein
MAMYYMQYMYCLVVPDTVGTATAVLPMDTYCLVEPGIVIKMAAVVDVSFAAMPGSA